MADGGIYQGNREASCDYFDDIMGDNSVPDIFKTQHGGLGNYESIRTTAGPEGIVVDFHCRPPGCGRGLQGTLEWPELFIAAHAPISGMLPNGWKRSEANAALYPDINCPSCGTLAGVFVQPNWARKQVEAALQGNVFNMTQLQQHPQVRQLQQIMQARGPQGGPPQGQPPPGYRGG